MRKYRKNRKIWTAFLLIICMVLSLAACGGKNSSPNENTTEINKVETTEAVLTPTQAASVPSANVPESTSAPTEPSETKTEEKQTPVQILSLKKQRNSNYDWDDTTLLVQSEYSNVTLWHEDAGEYPELAEVLEQVASMSDRSMENEYENLVSFAKEEQESMGDAFDTNVSTLDIQVRRADSVAVSLLSDSYSDFGQIEEFRAMHGSNYDTQTGKELKLSDVIKDMKPVPELVEQELNSHMWAGDFSYDSIVADYFKNTPEDGIRWTLDYNGVTFYFGPGDLAEEGFGSQSATISFAEHSELFEEKYMSVPEAFMVRLPMDHSFFTDLDGDAELEELNVTSFYNSDVGFYTQFGIYTDAGGHYDYQECFADDMMPYYVKTGDGGQYIYLFLEHREGMFPSFTLEVFDVSDAQCDYVGTRTVGPAYISSNLYRVPTDPENLYLDDYESMEQDAMLYRVGTLGLPEMIDLSPEGYTVTVGTVEELLDCIGPQVGIILKPGYYNLSEYIEDVWEREGEHWNETHPYVQLRDCYDGVEVVIRNVDGFSICGDGENRTEIVVDPRYAQVLNFKNCSDLMFLGLTMGHTETGECSGNVLDFYGCQNVILSAMDIYGCGFFGIGCYDGTGNMNVYSSTIRDCTNGPLEITNGVGRFEFRDCWLVDSGAYAHYEATQDSELAFYDCVFGENETSYFMFHGDVYTENCAWSENYLYPDYEPDLDRWITFDADRMEEIPIRRETIERTSWNGYVMVNPESGESVSLPYEVSDGSHDWVFMSLNEDGTGWFEDRTGGSDITWDCDDGVNAWITFEDGRNYYITSYHLNDKMHDNTWLLLEMEKYLVWMY